MDKAILMQANYDICGRNILPLNDLFILVQTGQKKKKYKSSAL